MELNPYAKFLGDADAMEVLRETPVRVAVLLRAVSPEGVERPRAPGKWSAREIVAHLADCELVFGFRLRQTLAEEHPVIQPFEQGVWAERYAAYDVVSAEALFAAARRWNVDLLGEVSEAEWKRPTTHPERGTMTLRTIAETMAGHDRNHLLQLEEIGRAG